MLHRCLTFLKPFIDSTFMKIRYTTLTIILFLFFNSLSAQVKLPSFFADDMILQQQTDVFIWGWANNGRMVTITPSWNGKKYTTQTNSKGQWKLSLPTPVAGGPYTLTIS